MRPKTRSIRIWRYACEALRQVEIAKDAWLKAAKAKQKRVLSPRYRPAICQLAIA
jgi:hypothetical protein